MGKQVAKRVVKYEKKDNRRTYLLYSRAEGTEVGLPWIALTMMSLCLTDRPLKIVEVAADISEGDEDKARAIYSSVYGAIRKLDLTGEIRVTGKDAERENRRYVVTVKGRKAFDRVMRIVEGVERSTLSDSVLLRSA